MSTYIRVIGPYESMGHIGNKSYWNVELRNDEKERTFDLVPWNERCSLSKQQAMDVALKVQMVTGYAIKKFKVERITTYNVTPE